MTLLALLVADEVVIGFFTAVVLGQTGAIVALWFYVIKLHERCCKLEAHDSPTQNT